MLPGNTVLVSCIDGDGNPNIITLAWSMPTSHNPPMVAISIAPKRYSHHLIKMTKEFIVNIPRFEQAKEALFCGRKSGRYVKKFEEAGLTPEPARIVRPPIIKECVAHLECRLVGTMETGDHTVFIGEVVIAYADPEAFREDRYVLKKVKPLLYLGSDEFVTTSKEIVSPNY